MRKLFHLSLELHTFSIVTKFYSICSMWMTFNSSNPQENDILKSINTSYSQDCAQSFEWDVLYLQSHFSEELTGCFPLALEDGVKVMPILPLSDMQRTPRLWHYALNISNNRKDVVVISWPPLSQQDKLSQLKLHRGQPKMLSDFF